jgi:uncharacterized membrane protein YcaP (DUF421 family)
MDPLRLAARALFAYALLLVLIRLAGKRTVKHGSVLDFTIALVVGDLVDDMIWAEVAVSQFVVAAGVLFMVHITFDVARFRSGIRTSKVSTLKSQ